MTIERIFSQLRQRGVKSLMPFLTAGDPDLATTEQLLVAMDSVGASVCELGIPFSDPIADGPVIQASMSYALDQGLKVAQVLEMVARIRPKLTMGLVAMASYSIVNRIGVERFVADSAAAGFDGFIFPDLPVEESTQATEAVHRANLTCSFLIAPTTPIERAERIARASSGFLYVLSRAGITGEQAQLPQDLDKRIEHLRGVTDLPIAVGFGISSNDQVRQVVKAADAAIIGSAIMRRVADHRAAGTKAVIDQVSRFMAKLANGLVV